MAQTPSRAVQTLPGMADAARATCSWPISSNWPKTSLAAPRSRSTGAGIAETHQARSSDRYLLYLVRTSRWQKFGVGGDRRVREHQLRGAEVVQVLCAPFAQVVLAESILKQVHGHATIGRVKRGMIASFGQGTEVVHRRITIGLTQVLPDSEDITSSFR